LKRRAAKYPPVIIAARNHPPVTRRRQFYPKFKGYDCFVSDCVRAVPIDKREVIIPVYDKINNLTKGLDKNLIL